MDERKKLRYQLIALGYLGGVIVMLFSGSMPITTGAALFFLWGVIIHLLGWFLLRRLRKRQEKITEESSGEAPISDTEHTARDAGDPGD